jgi:hypothetical protein
MLVGQIDARLQMDLVRPGLVLAHKNSPPAGIFGPDQPLDIRMRLLGNLPAFVHQPVLNLVTRLLHALLLSAHLYPPQRFLLTV